MEPDRTGTSRELLPALADLPGHLLWRAHARTLVIAEETLGDADLHTYAALLALSHQEALSQQTVADRVAVSRTTVATIAALSVRAGLVERIRNPQDKRAFQLSLTDTGLAMLKAWRPAVRDLDVRLGAAFSEHQQNHLVGLLRVVLGRDLDDQTPAELRSSLAFLITRAHQSMHREFATALLPLGLEPRHVGTLRALSSLGPVPQSDLGRAIGVSGASTVQIVDDLGAAGLVERVRSQNDRRTQMLHLLPEAASTLARALGVADVFIGARLADLSEPQVGDLVGLLRRFVTAP